MTDIGKYSRVQRDKPNSSESEVPEVLLLRVLAIDDAAWNELAAVVYPLATGICKRRGYRTADGDTSEEVALGVLERLRAKDFAAIRRFVETRKKYEGSRFSRWLGVVVHNVYIDHIRSQPEISRQRNADGRSLSKVQLCSLDDNALALSIASPDAPVPEVVEIGRFLRLLEGSEFPVDGRNAILLWLEGYSAIRLSLSDEKEAKRVLHAARQRLRRLVANHSNPREVCP